MIEKPSLVFNPEQADTVVCATKAMHDDWEMENGRKWPLPAVGGIQCMDCQTELIVNPLLIPLIKSKGGSFICLACFVDRTEGGTA